MSSAASASAASACRPSAGGGGTAKRPPNRADSVYGDVSVNTDQVPSGSAMGMRSPGASDAPDAGTAAAAADAGDDTGGAAALISAPNRRGTREGHQIGGRRVRHAVTTTTTPSPLSEKGVGLPSITESMQPLQALPGNHAWQS